MTPDEFDNVLSLMAAIIFADKQVYDSEVTTFLQSVSQLNFEQDFNPATSCQLTVTPTLCIEEAAQENTERALGRSISTSEISEWYEDNNGRIRETLSTPYFKDWFYGLLDQISHLPNKEKILSVMRDISKADGKVHVSERALITLAERHWGMR